MMIPTRRAEQMAAQRNRQADVDLAQLNVDRCTIIAPFDGQVDQLYVQEGERVQIGEVLLSLMDPNLIEIPVELPVSVHERVAIGSGCTLSVDRSSGPFWKGNVKRISPTADESTRTFKLYVEVNNTGQTRQLKPGYFVRAVIEGPLLENVLIVPRASIQQSSVFVFKDGRAYPRPIQIQRHLVDQTVVTGIHAGDMVITTNLDALAEGISVRVEEGPVEPEDKSRGGADSPAHFLAGRR